MSGCRLWLSGPRRYLESLPADQRGPLWGIPFAVKDNIDVAGYPTTAACPAFEYTPAQHARAVQPLFDAGELACWASSARAFLLAAPAAGE